MEFTAPLPAKFEEWIYRSWERTEAEQKALEAAARIRNLKQALNQPCQPEQTAQGGPRPSQQEGTALPEAAGRLRCAVCSLADGFEFSNEKLTLWMRRRQLQEEADDFKNYCRLPASIAEIPLTREIHTSAS